MAKIQFEDKSYIEVQKSQEPGKIMITIRANDANNLLKKIINSVEITTEQLQQLVAEIK